MPCFVVENRALAGKVGVVDAIVGVVKHHEANLELMASAFEALLYVCRNGASQRLLITPVLLLSKHNNSTLILICARPHKSLVWCEPQQGYLRGCKRRVIRGYTRF